MYFNLFGIIEEYEKIKNKEYYKPGYLNYSKIFIYILFILSLILFIWTIVVLMVFKLPRQILFLCILLLFLNGPIIPLILAYIFIN